MRDLKNIEAFEADYREFYKGNLDSLDFQVVLDEVIRSEGDYELKKYESNTGYGKTFFFDEVTICVDEENEEYDVIATYMGHGNN